MAVGGENRRAQIGTCHAELVGQTRPGEVLTFPVVAAFPGSVLGTVHRTMKSVGSTARVHVQ